MSTKWRRNEPYNVVSILFWYSCNVLAFHTTFYIDQSNPYIANLTKTLPRTGLNLLQICYYFTS